MSDMLVSSQAYFGQLVIVCSFLGGMVFGGLLCFRQTRRTGILGFAATCAVVALIVAGTEIAEGGRTIGHVLAAAAVIGFLFPIVGAAPACAIIGIARLLRAITRRTVKAMRTFSSNVVTDVLRIAKRRSDQECGPRRLSKASRLSTTFLVLTGTMFIGLNMGAISALATRFAPRLSIVTNCLDLISLILVTPKLFTIEERDNVRDLSIQTLRPFTITKITIPRNILTPVLRATMFVLLLFIIKYLLDYNASKILVICGTFNKIFVNIPSLGIFANPFCDYISKHVIENQTVFAKMWSFGRPVMFLSGVVVISVTLLRFLRAIAKSPEAQEKLNDMALFLGLVVFTYSRALSMMD